MCVCIGTQERDAERAAAREAKEAATRAVRVARAALLAAQQRAMDAASAARRDARTQRIAEEQEVLMSAALKVCMDSVCVCVHYTCNMCRLSPCEQSAPSSTCVYFYV